MPKQMQIEIVEDYDDKKLGVYLPAGVIMTYDSKTAEALIAQGVARLIQELPDSEPEAPKAKEKRKKNG